MPAIRAASKETNMFRSFTAYVYAQLSGSFFILYGDEADAFPEEVENNASSQNQVLIVRDLDYGGGRGEEPHHFTIQVVTRKAFDRHGARAEDARDAVKSALNANIPMYDFSNRSNPTIIGNNYNLYPRYRGSSREDEEKEQLSRWTLSYDVHSSSSDMLH